MSDEMDENSRERWRGKVDAEISSLQSSIRDMWRQININETAHNLLELKVEKIATRIGIYASLGAFIGGGIMSIIVGFFFHK